MKKDFDQKWYDIKWSLFLKRVYYNVNGWKTLQEPNDLSAHFRKDTGCPKGQVPSLTLVNPNKQMKSIL